MADTDQPLTPDVLVLHTGVHGMPVEDYAAELRERLPDREVELARTATAARERIAGARVATGRTVDRATVEAADDLDLFACAYAGVDHLPTDALEAQGVAVTNAAGVHGPNVAEHVLGSILVFARRLHEGWRRGNRGEWRHYPAGELQGSTVTVVGLGAIGEAVVDRLAGFGVETVGVRYTPEKGGPTDEVSGFDGIDAALARTDYLVLACPLTDTTRGLVDADALETLPPEAVVVNVARGPVVDTPALVEALRSERIAGAALDVTDPEPLPADHPLWTLENCLVTPHNAGHTPHYYERLADIVAGNVRRLETGEELENRVV
jgi:phosphoglycerate dehydrogenase-like enzyme